MGWRLLGSAFTLLAAYLAFITVRLELEEWVHLPTPIWSLAFGVIGNLILAWLSFSCANQPATIDQEDGG